MFSPAAFTPFHLGAGDVYNDSHRNYFVRAIKARAEYLDAALLGAVEVPSKVAKVVYELLRGLTVGVLLVRDEPSHRFFQSVNGLSERVGNLFWGVVGVACPYLAVKGQAWVGA